MSPFKIGFQAAPKGGPGIFLTRLQEQLQQMGCFDAVRPDCWIQLCYEPLPADILADSNVKKVIRVDGVYSLRYHFISKPMKIPLPVVDDIVSRRKNNKRNRPIIQNLALADEIIYQSEFSRQATQRFISPTPPGAIIFNGIDTDAFCPNPSPIRDDRQVNILVSHSFRPHKRLHEAIRIVAALQTEIPDHQWTLQVVGGDDGQSIRYARKMMCQLRINPDSVVFHGKQPYDRLHEIYTQCDFVLGLSFWDFCPNVIVEALSCGLPVLGVDFGGIPELVGNAGRLIPENIPFDYMDLYDFNALPKVDTNRYVTEARILMDNLAEYQTKARERALKELDIRHTAKQYYNACERLIQPASCAP